MHFGSLLRDKRIRGGQTLRGICKSSSYDIAYISRIERGLLPAPKSLSGLERLLNVYGIYKNEEEWDRYVELARRTLFPY
jgi:transcriptional regulator with XRE-family HTH domain